MRNIATFAALLVATFANAQQPTTTTTTTASPTPTMVPPTWSNCAKSPMQMKVTSFSVSPLCAGQTLQFTVTGNLTTSIDQGASFRIVGKYLNIVFYSDTYDLCQILAAAGTPCPIATNIASFTLTTRTKPQIPVGIPMVFSVQARNNDGGQIFCQSATVTASNCGQPPYTPPPTTVTSSTTMLPKPTPVPGVWKTCNGSQNMTLSSLTISPNAWCRGKQTCINIAGTLLNPITWSAILNLYGGASSSLFNSFDIDLRGAGYPYQIPAGPLSFSVCGNISLYTPEKPSTWRLNVAYSEQIGPTSFHWVDLLCLDTTNQFVIPACP